MGEWADTAEGQWKQNKTKQQKIERYGEMQVNGLIWQKDSENKNKQKIEG